jgi:hypothetical protein
MTKTPRKHDENHLWIYHSSQKLRRAGAPAQMVEAAFNVFFENYKVRPLQIPLATIHIPAMKNA